jgi:hypothetical protein
MSALGYVYTKDFSVGPWSKTLRVEVPVEDAATSAAKAAWPVLEAKLKAELPSLVEQVQKSAAAAPASVVPLLTPRIANLGKALAKEYAIVKKKGAVVRQKELAAAVAATPSTGPQPPPTQLEALKKAVAQAGADASAPAIDELKKTMLISAAAIAVTLIGATIWVRSSRKPVA